MISIARWIGRGLSCVVMCRDQGKVSTDVEFVVRCRSYEYYWYCSAMYYDIAKQNGRYQGLKCFRVFDFVVYC